MMEDTWSPVMMTDTEDAAAEWRSDAQLDQTQERKGGECFAKNFVAFLGEAWQFMFLKCELTNFDIYFVKFKI